MSRARIPHVFYRRWWDVESVFWDRRAAQAHHREDIDTITGWITALPRGGRARVLDVGCGTGHYTNRLADTGCAATGIDFSTGMIRRARRSASALVNPPAYVQVDLRQGLPFPTASFDVVLCVHVLQVVDEPQVFLREARRVVAAGGRLVLVAFNGEQSSPVRASTTPERAFRIVKHSLIRAIGVETYDAAALARMLGDAGFGEIERPALAGREAVIARPASA